MTKTERPLSKCYKLEKLIVGFVHEAKLEGLGTSIGTVEMNVHGNRSRAYADEFIARDELLSLNPLLDHPDKWIAHSTAVALRLDERTTDEALATLDRIADERSGNASAAAHTARNMIRFGDPLGDPVEVEKQLAQIRARHSR